MIEKWVEIGQREKWRRQHRNVVMNNVRAIMGIWKGRDEGYGRWRGDETI
jgi:hypothetical protein